MDKKVFNAIVSAEIFCKADRNVLSNILNDENIVVREFKKDETIFSVDSFSYSVGIIVCGSAKVVKNENGVLMSILERNDIFGCASLFSSRDYYVNDIIALKDCSVAFIDRETVRRIMLADHDFSVEFIRYLSDRLYYLNTRILSFTGSSIESRVANYLYSVFQSTGKTCVNLSLSKLAFSVDVARASLYRALEKLCSGGAISKQGKELTLVDVQKLESFMHQNN